MGDSQGKQPYHRHKFIVRGGQSQVFKRIGHGWGVWVDWACKEPACLEIRQKWEKRDPPSGATK